MERIKKAELILVKKIAEIKSIKSSQYLPIPEIEGKELKAIQYLVYDCNKLSNEAISAIDQLTEKFSNHMKDVV